MSGITENTGTFMLSREVELLMAERAKLLRVAGAAAQLVAAMDSRSLPERVTTDVLGYVVAARSWASVSRRLAALGRSRRRLIRSVRRAARAGRPAGRVS